MMRKFLLCNQDNLKRWFDLSVYCNLALITSTIYFDFVYLYTIFFLFNNISLTLVDLHIGTHKYFFFLKYFVRDLNRDNVLVNVEAHKILTAQKSFYCRGKTFTINKKRCYLFRVCNWNGTHKCSMSNIYIII